MQEAGTPAGPPPASALVHREFRIYWMGQAVSLAGAWMQQVAQGWVIVGLTGSTATIASIAFVASLPQLLFLFHGGLVADRNDRRNVLLVTQVALAALAFAYAGLVASDHLTLPLVYLLGAALGVVIAFDVPAQQALVPQLVPPAAIPQAVALIAAVFHGTRLVGPALAGLLIAWGGVAMAFVANGASYFAVIASLLLIRPRGPAARPAASSMAAMREGLGYAWRHRETRVLIGFTGLTMVAVFPFLIVFMPIAVKTVFHGDEHALGLVMSASGLGAMSGALLLLRIRHRRGRFILAAAVLAGSGLCSLSFVSRPGPAAVLVAVTSLGVSTSLGLAGTLIQMAVPDALRGRVMSLQMLNFTALMPSSALLLGWLGQAFGLGTLFRLAGAGYALAAVAWLIAAGVWRYGEGEGPAGRPGANASGP